MACATSARAVFVISVTFIYWPKHYIVVRCHKDSFNILVYQILKKIGTTLLDGPCFVQVAEQLLALLHTTLLDTCLLTCKVTQVVDTCTTYYTILVHLDVVDVG